MADENYNDEFAEDEQQSQSFSKKLELMQMKISELSSELDAERTSHIQTKQYLTAARDDSLSLSVESLGLSSARTNPGAGMTLELKTEFFKLCSKFSIPMTCESVKAMTDSDGVQILKAVSKKLAKTSSSGSADSNAADGEESDAGSRIRALEKELRLALGAAEDIRALKAKVIQMIDRTRAEKELKLRAEAELATVKKKMEIIGDHMEKLMTNLRHEATAKIRSLEALRITEKKVETWKSMCDVQIKKNAIKERLVAELREGSKILEDQLRLMDEKYLELRIKLDWSREHGMKKLKQAEKAASTLRMKYVLSTGGSLDSVSLPDISASSQSSMASHSFSMADNELQSVHSKARSKGSRTGKKHSQQHRDRYGEGEGEGEEGDDGSRSRVSALDFEQVQKKLLARSGEKEEWTEARARELACTR